MLFTDMSKKYTWCFMGQIHAGGSREKMVDQLKSADDNYFCNVNESWQSGDSLSTKEYKFVLENSIFCPCPKGNNSVDTFRLYEALESESIPIVEQDEYWEKMYPGNPLLQTDSDWIKAQRYIQYFLSRPEKLISYRNTLLKWWKSQKLKLKANIKQNESKKNELQKLDSIKHKEFLKLAGEWPNLVGRDYLKYISKNLNKLDVPQEKFTVYNPGKKIAIVSLYTKEIEDYAICSEISIRDYCLARGYTFYVYRESLQKDASPNWSKARALLNHFDDHEDIIWMDSDTIIYNPEKRFEDILDRCSATKKIVACEDIGTNNKNMPKGSILNSGVVIFRNHRYTKNMLKKWMNFDGDKNGLYASGGDQEILCSVLKASDGFGFNRKIFPMNKFNTEPRMIDDDTFIVHFMAYPFYLKKIFMRYLIES